MSAPLEARLVDTRRMGDPIGLGRVIRLGVVALGIFVSARPAVAADTQVRPFIGMTFGGGTTYVDLEGAAGKQSLTFGLTVARLGNIFGFDVDFADAPGFFQAGEPGLVLGSRVTTLTGNVIIAAPRRLTEYSLRPYFVGGAGLMRVRIEDYFSVFQVADVIPGIDMGGGVIGFLTNRVGVGWEVRRFQNIGHASQNQGVSIGGPQLSFWRASMSLALRY